MSEPKLEDRLSSEEGNQKAASLFSQKFREYLMNKKSFSSKENKYLKPSTWAKDYSVSSDETSASESSKKSGRKVRKKLKEKQSFYCTYKNRLTQCILLKNDEAVESPEDLKPLLLNMTVFLQELKQSPSEFDNLYNLISKITILVTEFIRRPLKKTHETHGEHAMKVEKTIEMMMTLLQEYKKGQNFDSDNRIREYKRLEKDISYKTNKIAEAERQLSEETPQNDPKIKEVLPRLKNSLMVNANLKSTIKFNQNHVKKYKKLLLEKEWIKHKLEAELSHLKKKISKADLCDGEPQERQQPQTPETSVRGENVHVSFAPMGKTTKPKKGKEVQKSTAKLK